MIGLSLTLVAGARAACTDPACLDQGAVDALRTEIAQTCECATAKSHKKYMKCVRGAIKDAVEAETLPKECKKAVKGCEGDSTCGRPGAAVCCEMNDVGAMEARVVKKPERCGATVCTALPSTADACKSDATCAPLVRPFKTIQQVFTQSCALPSCHSAIAREGDLVLESEELSWESLVDHASAHEDAVAMGLMRVKSGDPANSFLMRKLRNLGPGDTMPQAAPVLSDVILDMIEDWIARGAHTTDEECPALAEATPGQAAAISQEIDVRVGRHSGHVQTVCDDDPITGDYVWKPEEPLEPPPADEGIQIYVPKKDIPRGTEWETCYAVQFDWSQLAQDFGYTSGLPVIEKQVYRMHQGSHHLLLYAYWGPTPQGWKLNEFFPCFAASCLEDNPDDCPPDASQWTLPIGGTQVAGINYTNDYPEGVGLPVLSPTTVIIANLHYTNPFQPPQDTYGEAWINLSFYKPGEFKALLDGIFAVNYLDLLVEPYESKLMSRIWKPRSILTGQPADAAVFQLFGHMHKRGALFDIDFVRDGACSVSGALCGRDDDCACRPYQGSCVEGQTCILGPTAEDSRLYHTTKWDHAPVQDYPKPFLEVDRDEGLRWTCNLVNGVAGDDTRPPKRCHPGCNSCEWRAERNQCVFEREICLNYVNLPCGTDADCPEGRTCEDIDCNNPGGNPGNRRCARVYDKDEPIPLVFGELADDDMCNMFGYFLRQEDVAKLP